MITFSVRGWSAWAPGIQSSEDWASWARAPRVPALDGWPELKFIPAMQRRRFSRLSKLALQVAFDATPPELLADTCSVFASRHGESNACVVPVDSPACRRLQHHAEMSSHSSPPRRKCFASG